MQGVSAMWIANRVKWKMRRFSTPEMILFPSDKALPSAGLRDAAEGKAAGVPILAMWRSSELWTLLGSETLAWAWDGEVGAMSLDALTKVEEKTLDETAVSVPKRLLETLYVTDTNNSTFRVWAPHDCLWRLRAVLTMLIKMQKKAT